MEGAVPGSRLRGCARWSALDPLPPSERLPAIIEHRNWHHWGLFRALLDASHCYSACDPRQAADIAQLALDIADILDPLAVGGEPVARDMRARAWNTLGHCRRLVSDLAGARTAIAEAWRWNEEGTGDLLDKARIYRCDAAYTAAVGELETAMTILEGPPPLAASPPLPPLLARTVRRVLPGVGALTAYRLAAAVRHQGEQHRRRSAPVCQGAPSGAAGSALPDTVSRVAG